MNKSFIRYEEKIKAAPTRETLAKVEATCRDAQQRYEEVRARADALEKANDEKQREIFLLQKERDEAKMLQEASNSHAVSLVSEKSALNERVIELTAQIKSEAKRAARAGKREMIEAYQSILEVIKAKFEKRKIAAKAQVKVQEIQANIDLLEEIIGGKIQDLAAERDTLRNVLLPKRALKLKKRAVSDLSLGKLDLPQVSEGSNQPMDVDPASVIPPSIDQHGSHLPETAGTEEEDEDKASEEEEEMEKEEMEKGQDPPTDGAEDV